MAHPWPSFSPEANYTALMSGSGPASTLAYSDTLCAEAANLQTIAASSTATGAATYGAGWRGTGAAASATSQTGMDTQHELLAAALLEKVPHVAAAAAAHQTALASMVTAEQAVANRMEEAADQQINWAVLGALTPRIAALNVEYYGQMWPRNAAAGAAYGAVLRASTAALMVPFPPAVAGASAAAPAVAATGLAENAAMSAAGATMQAGEQAVQAAITPAAAVSQVAATPRAAPMAATQTPAQTVPKAPQTPSGMFARPPQAAVPAAPNAATPGGRGLTAAQFDQALASRAETLSPPTGSAPGSGAVGGYPGAGLTSFVRPPGDGFTPPPAEQATSGRPGMLNAPLTTTNSSLTAAQPLAYVPLNHPGHRRPRPRLHRNTGCRARTPSMSGLRPKARGRPHNRRGSPAIRCLRYRLTKCETRPGPAKAETVGQNNLREARLAEPSVVVEAASMARAAVPAEEAAARPPAGATQVGDARAGVRSLHGEVLRRLPQRQSQRFRRLAESMGSPSMEGIRSTAGRAMASMTARCRTLLNIRSARRNLDQTNTAALGNMLARTRQ